MAAPARLRRRGRLTGGLTAWLPILTERPEIGAPAVDPITAATTPAPSERVFDALPDALLRFDRSLRVVYANVAVERATALARLEFIGRRLGELERFAPFARLWDGAVEGAFETLEERSFKFTFPHPTGAKSFDVRLVLEFDALRRATHVTALLRDVTVPRTALRASREADAFVDTVMASAQIGIAVLDAQLRLREWNAFMERLIGVAAPRVLGRGLTELFDFGAEPQIPAALEQMRHGGLRGSMQADLEFPGGSRPWVRIRSSPLHDGRGRFSGVLLTAERIDRERFAETSLAALRQALDTAGEMVFEIQRDGRVVDANETALAWLGYTRDQLTDLDLAAIDVGLSAGRFGDLLEALGARGAYQGEARYRTRFGSEFPVDVVLQRVEHAGREFIFMLARDISDRKRIEAALADNAERFSTVFNESPVGNILLDRAFRVVTINPATTSLTGYREHDLAGRDPALLVHPDDLEVMERLRERLRAGAAVATERSCRLLGREGALLWVKPTLRLLSTVGTGRSYLLVLENFTERKIFEEQLQVALRDQQTLLETMAAGVVQVSDGKVLLANREFSRLFDYLGVDVIGMPLWDLCRGGARERPTDDVSGLPAVRAGETTSAEVILYRADGKPLWCVVHARPIERDGAASNEAIYTFQDVSELKRQREALTGSLLELNVVLDAAPVGVLHLDRDGRVRRSNAQAQNALDLDADHLAGRAFSDLFAEPADSGQILRPVALADGPVATTSIEARLFGPGGRPFWALVTARAIGASGAHAGGSIVTLVNISERRRADEQLQTLLGESRLLFDTALVGLLFIRDGQVVRANSAMEDLLGCDPGTLIDQMSLFTHPTDTQLAFGLAQRYDEIRERGACEFEFQMQRRGGDSIWVAVQGREVSRNRPELGYIFAFIDIDQRMRSERELRTALAELQLIFDNALVSMTYVAADLVIKANAATERMFGLTDGIGIDLSVATLFADPADWNAIREACAATRSDPTALGQTTFESLMRRADGAAFWCSGTARPIAREAPERGMIVAFMDVDQRRRSEDELRRIQNRLTLVVENLPVMVSVREADSGRFVSVNRAGESILGLPRDQIVGRTWHEIYGRRFADLFAAMDRQAIATGTQIDRPRDVMLRADGRTLTIDQRVVPLFEEGDPQHRARYVMSIIDDRTDEVRAEAALRETETRFLQFAENIDQIVFIANADLSRLFYVNARYSQLAGMPAGPLLEDPAGVLVHVPADEARDFRRGLPRLLAEVRRLRRAEFTLRLRHPLRGLRQFSVRLSPARMFDGSISVFGIADDVTERAAAEQQRLADAVKQRDILVREVHHRIKNNLHGVAGLLQQMAHGKPQLEPMLNEIATQIQAIAQVHGLQIHGSGTLPVLGLIQGIFASLSSTFGAEIRLEAPAAALWRWGVPEGEAVPIALVINELTTNAIKHRGDRNQALAVRVEPRSDGVTLQIENPGELASSFDLARISSSLTGLGLVRALLPRRGARLSIEQSAGSVVTRLEMAPPAIREDRSGD
jgi:PAS domain S-box-containing protein